MLSHVHNKGIRMSVKPGCLEILKNLKLYKTYSLLLFLLFLYLLLYFFSVFQYFNNRIEFGCNCFGLLPSDTY